MKNKDHLCTIGIKWDYTFRWAAVDIHWQRSLSGQTKAFNTIKAHGSFAFAQSFTLTLYLDNLRYWILVYMYNVYAWGLWACMCKPNTSLNIQYELEYSIFKAAHATVRTGYRFILTRIIPHVTHRDNREKEHVELRFICNSNFVLNFWLMSVLMSTTW